MEKRKSLIVLLLTMFLSICIIGCSDEGKDERKEDGYYIQIATTDIISILNENNIEFESVSSEFWFGNQGAKWYYMLIEFDNMTMYKQIFTDLKLVDSLYKSDEESKKAEIHYKIIGLRDGEKYEIESSSYSYGYIDELTCNYKTVYNDIAGKNGVNLTIEEKATIYGNYKWYLEAKNNNGSYKYTYKQAREIVANRFNITTDYIINEIDRYAVWTEYWTGYYNK